MIRSIREGIEVPQYHREKRVTDTRGSYGPKILSDNVAAIVRLGVEDIT